MTISAQPEFWGGVECTLNRVGDRRHDQIARSGHAGRPSDYELFASLGIKKLRYPLLWERVAREYEELHWNETDSQIEKLNELGIVPIVGLLHHGSGPEWTSLVDDDFPVKFAAYALAVARRYPWLQYYTPINEPLTTARFSGLYGHWHPHGSDDFVFTKVLLNQCKATILAMEAIRTVNPRAMLIATEDVAPVYSTETLAYQAEFENERRWSSLDLLAGKLVRGTRMRDHFRWLSVPESALDWFEDHACPPDLIGIDYYPSSERFLDENWQLYPPSARGGNLWTEYADVEAVRVREEGIDGQLALIEEVWHRYERPIALTECHIACDVDEQIAWFYQSWSAAIEARTRHIPVVGVTLWSLLGAYDWDTLCTLERGYYEPGAFDISSGVPTPTALAAAASRIVAGEYTPKLTAGWWHRPDRLLYPPISAPRAIRRDRVKERSAC